MAEQIEVKICWKIPLWFLQGKIISSSPEITTEINMLLNDNRIQSYKAEI